MKNWSIQCKPVGLPTKCSIELLVELSFQVSISPETHESIFANYNMRLFTVPKLTLLPTAFYDFLSYGSKIFIPHPRKQCENYSIDLKFGTHN